MTRQERLNAYWSWRNIQEGMRQVDVLLTQIEKWNHSSGAQLIGTDIVARFCSEMEQAFFDAAAVAAAKREADRS